MDRATFRLIATGIMTIVVTVAPTGVHMETLRATSRMTVSELSIISEKAVKEDLSVCQGFL